MYVSVLRVRAVYMHSERPPGAHQLSWSQLDFNPGLHWSQQLLQCLFWAGLSADRVNLLLGRLILMKQKCSNALPVSARIRIWTVLVVLALVPMCERLGSLFASLPQMFAVCHSRFLSQCAG